MRASLLEELPTNLRAHIEGLSGRSAAGERETLVSQLCSLRPYKGAELALLFERDTKKFVEKYLSPMRKKEKLKWLYPEIPSHPLQAYFTPSS